MQNNQLDVLSRFSQICLFLKFLFNMYQAEYVFQILNERYVSLSHMLMLKVFPEILTWQLLLQFIAHGEVLFQACRVLLLASAQRPGAPLSHAGKGK